MSRNEMQAGAGEQRETQAKRSEQRETQAKRSDGSSQKMARLQKTALALALLTTGCFSQQRGPSTQPTTQPYTLALETRVRLYTQAATLTYISTARTDEQRIDRTKRLREAAQQALTWADDPNIDPAVIRERLVDLALTNQSETTRAAAQLLVTIVGTEIRLALGIGPDEKIPISIRPETRDLIKAAAEAALSATK